MEDKVVKSKAERDEGMILDSKVQRIIMRHKAKSIKKKVICHEKGFASTHRPFYCEAWEGETQESNFVTLYSL